VSLFHVISSIDSHICISFQSCSNSLDDADEYARALADSYQELKTALGTIPSHRH
jgi:hypothetical protein